MPQQPGGEDASSDDLIRFSKLLSFLLRHRPDALGLDLSPAGWVEVDVLLKRINEERKLPFRVVPGHLERLVDSSSRFQLREGRVRARTGHSVRIQAPVKPVEVGDPVPEFLFAVVPEASSSEIDGQGLLVGSERALFVPEEPEEPSENLAVVEAARARRGGVHFERVPGGFQVSELPLRYVVSHRRGYTRQISAGGVLVRGDGPDAEFALIRTRPRDQAKLEEPEEFQDPREDRDRRAEDRRRGEEEGPPPTGVERRRGSRRRSRRRRSGRWSRDGRLELPKGKLEPGETPEQAAVREVREELGIAQDLSVLERLSFNNYVFRTPEGRPIFKTVHYYLLRCEAAFELEFEPALDEGIVSVEWWSGQRAIAQVAFANLRPVLERAWEMVQG